MSGFRTLPFPRSRRIIVDTGRAARYRHPIHGLFEADITEPLERLRGAGSGPSLTSYVVTSLGRAVAGQPEVHALRDLRGRLVIFDAVDINVMVEVELEGRSFPLNHVVRECHQRTLGSIDEELRSIRRSPTDSPTFLLADSARLFLLLPGFLRARLVRLLRRLPHRQRDLAGTVGVSSVGMYGRGGGWGIGFTVHTLNVLVGGLVERPGLVDGEVLPRTFLQLTLTFDHDIVDGGPAARFAERLREILESGQVI